MEFSVKLFGCLFLIFSALLGGTIVEWDLNVWVPVLHRMWPNAFNYNGPIELGWFVKILTGLFLTGPAITIGAISLLLLAVGIISR